MNTNRSAGTRDAKLLSGTPLLQYPNGRVCEVRDCSTRLSRRPGGGA